MTSARHPFLTAEWRHLAMLNYPVERPILEPCVPAGTALDTYKGVAYVSLVAFRFLRTRLLGVPVPFHQEFEEVNLRFYVRRFDGTDWKRGVVFIKEIVPKPAVALVARRAYNENYVALPMKHRLDTSPAGALVALEYSWQYQNRWTTLHVDVAGEPFTPAAASLEEFITEHYWGYARQPDGGCLEYEVEHPRWRVWQTSAASLDGEVRPLYGESFATALAGAPASAFVAEGSAVTVHHGCPLDQGPGL
ncbi:MAG TPA: DUF2071 domain-containing protein [Verrucomicrobiae bacterium]|nr:DUF2071 domain-containing protein [Verrucomicrobiae bacterium]